MGVLSMLNFPLPVQSSNLSLGIQKPSHVTNIHWKFHDFLPSSLRVIKVSHFTLRSEDSVMCKVARDRLLLIIPFLFLVLLHPCTCPLTCDSLFDQQFQSPPLLCYEKVNLPSPSSSPSSSILSPFISSATLVACGWAGAVFEIARVIRQEPWGQRIKKHKKSKMWPTDGRTDGQSGV